MPSPAIWHQTGTFDVLHCRAIRRAATESGVGMKSEGHGWILFSMIVLITAGIMRIFDGIWAIHNANALISQRVSLTGSVFGSSLKTYGWIYLLIGVALVLIGLALASGSEVARWLGMVAGGVLAISAIWWIVYYPFMSMVYVGLGVAVIYGLAMYGGHESVATE
jgi:hypothetical protein